MVVFTYWSEDPPRQFGNRSSPFVQMDASSRRAMKPVS